MTVHALRTTPSADAGGPTHAEPLDVAVGRTARDRPEHPAVLSSSPGPAHVLTYGDLADACARVAAGLRAHGVRAGDVVAVVGDSGPDQVAATLAVLAVGARVLPLPPQPPGAAALHAIADLGVAAEVRTTDRDLRPLGAGPVLSLHELVRTSTAVGPAPEELPPLLDRAGFVCLTSGTSAAPRALAHTHAALVQIGAWLGGHLDLGPASRVGQWSLPGYDAQLVETAAALLAGATLCPVPGDARLDPAEVLDWLARAQITWLQTVPSFARALVEEARRTPRALPALRAVALAGEPLTVGLARDLHEVLGARRVVNLYGASETILATYHDVPTPPDGPAADPLPVGRAIPGREVLVLDEAGQPCIEGVTGEVVVRSEFVADGCAEPSSTSLTPVRTYRTGDHGRWRHGVLWFQGRGDDVVKVGGRRVRLGQVESVIGAVAGVSVCVVLPDAEVSGLVGGLVAYVVPVEGGGDAAAVRAALRHHLGSSLPPVRVRFTDHLPRNRGGKLDRSRLRDPGPGVPWIDLTQRAHPARADRSTT